MPRRSNETEFDELMRTLYRVRELKDPDPRILRAIENRLKEIAENETTPTRTRKQTQERDLFQTDSTAD